MAARRQARYEARNIRLKEIEKKQKEEEENTNSNHTNHNHVQHPGKLNFRSYLVKIYYLDLIWLIGCPLPSPNCWSLNTM